MLERSSDRIPRGTWVELSRTLLAAGERAPQVPQETQDVPLEMRVKGILTCDGVLGEEAEVVTPAGRTLRGRLSVACPAYTHSFGPPVAELLAARDELLALLEGEGSQRGRG